MSDHEKWLTASLAAKEERIRALEAQCDRFATAAVKAEEVRLVLVEALEACLRYIPGSEVRSWPAGFGLREVAMTKANAALEKAARL